MTEEKVTLIRGTPEPEKLVCEAARNDYRSDGVADHSFEDVMEGVEGNTIEEKKENLLKHLMHSGHWGPFEHPSATLELKNVTRVAMAQITRHRHFTFDIQSLRYNEVDSIDDMKVPEGYEDASFEIDDVEVPVEGQFRDAYGSAMYYYDTLVDNGVAPEEARKVLPMGTTVNIVMSGNARAWLHLLNIRGKGNVQGEARRLSDQIHEELVEWMPFTFEHYDEEILPLQLNP